MLLQKWSWLDATGLSGYRPSIRNRQSFGTLVASLVLLAILTLPDLLWLQEKQGAFADQVISSQLFRISLTGYSEHS